MFGFEAYNSSGKAQFTDANMPYEVFAHGSATTNVDLTWGTGITIPFPAGASTDFPMLLIRQTSGLGSGYGLHIIGNTYQNRIQSGYELGPDYTILNGWIVVSSDTDPTIEYDKYQYYILGNNSSYWAEPSPGISFDYAFIRPISGVPTAGDYGLSIVNSSNSAIYTGR